METRKPSFPLLRPIFLLSLSLAFCFYALLLSLSPPSNSCLFFHLLFPCHSPPPISTSTQEPPSSLASTVAGFITKSHLGSSISQPNSNTAIHAQTGQANESHAELSISERENHTFREDEPKNEILISGSDSSVDVSITGENIPNGKQNATFFQGNNTLVAAPASFEEPNNIPSSISHPDLLQRCHISQGKWVYDHSYPLYRPASCPFVDEGFSCSENGRPDSAYMSWRWKPDDCDIPRLNATDMLESLKGKRLVFAGDSLHRNQFESLLCILWEGISDKNRMIEIHGRRITKGQGSYSFKFLDYNCYVEFYRSHFLVDEARTFRNGTRKARQSLKLDKIDRSQSKWRNADILVFNTGHWWTHTKTAKGRNYFQEGDHVFQTLPVPLAYKKALTTWAAWVDKYVDPAHTQVYFRGYSPAHFRGGQWNSGGQCNKETEPIFNDSYLSDYPDKMVILEEVIQQMRTPVTLLNVTKLSDYRKDAHPSIYGQRDSNRKRIQDCSHWCLPGLPDIWNELLYAFLLNSKLV